MDHILSIQNAIRNNGLEAMLITGASNVFYATGFPGADCTALVTGSGAWVFTDSRYIEAATNKIKSATVLETNASNPLMSLVKKILSDSGISKLGFEEEKVSFSAYTSYKEKLGVELVPAQQVVSSLRWVKSREELDIMIKAQRIAEAAFNEVIENLRFDMTESELAAELVYRMICHGAEDKSFDVIAVSGEKSSMPHGVPEQRVLRKGFLTIDFGAKYQGYCSDTTRTVCIGKPDDEMKKIYNTVFEAQAAGIAAAKGGVMGKVVDGAARKVIEDAGYGKYFGHSFGHSLGIDIHEAPGASPREERQIPVGAVVSAEPGIYIPGKYGVRIEDVVYFTETGCENITKLPKELMVL